MALNSLYSPDVPLSNYSLTHSLLQSLFVCVCEQHISVTDSFR